MSFSTYSDLQTSVGNYLARSDLTSVIPDFVTLFETEANRRLRVRQMMVTQSTTPSSGQFALPSDYLAHVNLRWTGSPIADLEYVHPTQFANLYSDQPASTPPKLFTIYGTTDSTGIVKFTPSDTTALDFTYYQKVTALSTSNTSNWLLAAHPDVYLAGSLSEAYFYTKDYDQSAAWGNRRDAGLDSITRLDQKSRGPSRIRVIGQTP